MKLNQALTIITAALAMFCCGSKDKVELNNDVDSLSYYIGRYSGAILTNINLKKFNKQAFDQAVTEALRIKSVDSLLAKYQASDSIIDKYVIKYTAIQQQQFLREGRAFLAENKKRKGVITTASGLQYEIIKKGTGLKAGLKDSVVVQYKGFILNGPEFLNSYNGGNPTRFLVKDVYPLGWREVFQLMEPGASYKLYLDPDLAYGANPIPTPDDVLKPNMIVMFDIDMISVLPQ